MVFNPFNTFRIFKCKLELTYYQAASRFSWFNTRFLILLSIPLSLKEASNSLSTGSHPASVFQWILQNQHELVQWTTRAVPWGSLEEEPPHSDMVANAQQSHRGRETDPNEHSLCDSPDMLYSIALSSWEAACVVVLHMDPLCHFCGHSSPLLLCPFAIAAVSSSHIVQITVSFWRTLHPLCLPGSWTDMKLKQTQCQHSCPLKCLVLV